MDSSITKKYIPTKVSYFGNALAIYLVDFPVYYVGCISERHFVVAGGGGSSNTGVHNQINIFELTPTNKLLTANLVMKFNTPKNIPDAIMNGALMRDLPVVSPRFVTGGRYLTVYNIHFNPVLKTFEIFDHEVVGELKNAEAELKCVSYIPGKILTGGIDGHLTIWNSIGNNNRVDAKIRAHTKAIDEIDVDLPNQQIITLSRDEEKCSIWDLTNMKLIHELKKDSINNSNVPGVKYNYRSCKYAYDKTSQSSKSAKDSYLLVAINCASKTHPGLLYKWTSSNFKECISKSLTLDNTMAMAVSLDGEFVAIGTRSGSISVLEVKNLKQIYNIKEAHDNPVTNLDFLPSKPETLSLTNSKTCALISVSIDRRIILHRPEKKSRTRPFLCFVFFFIVHLMFFYYY